MTDRLVEIFQCQRQLIDKFHAIERENVPHVFIPQNDPVFHIDDFDSFAGQARLRELAGRIFEEVCEALDVALVSDVTDPKYVEEVADAFHFLVEFLTIVGVTGEGYNRGDDLRLDRLSVQYAMARDGLVPDEGFYFHWLLFLKDLGSVLNQLKNKPWKQSARLLPSVPYFITDCAVLLPSFLRAVLVGGIAADGLYEAYMKKEKINHNRILTGV